MFSFHKQNFSCCLLEIQNKEYMYFPQQSMLLNIHWLGTKSWRNNSFAVRFSPSLYTFRDKNLFPHYELIFCTLCKDCNVLLCVWELSVRLVGLQSLWQTT